MFSNCVISMIEKFGKSIEVCPKNSDVVHSKAFIQPLRYKDQMYMGGKCIDIGYLNGNSYLYIGKKDLRLDLYPFNTVIKTNEASYVVKRAQAVYLGDDILYVWAILQVYVEDENK